MEVEGDVLRRLDGDKSIVWERYTLAFVELSWSADDSY